MRSLGKLNFLRSRYCKFIIGAFFCVFLITATHTNVYADCDPDFPDPNCLGDPDAPLDGGVGFLVAAGVAYGVKKMRDKRKGSLLS